MAEAATSFTNGQAARAVIGQNDFTDGAIPPVVNTLQTAAVNLLGGATGLAYSNGLLFVADDNRLGAYPENDRVMIFNTSLIPGPYTDMTTFSSPNPRCPLCGIGPVGLLGQPDYFGTQEGRSSLPTATAGSMNKPVAVATDGRHFAVADSDNNRVLLWNSVPTNQTMPPDLVLGQANFTAFQTPQLVNANSLRGPQGVWFQNGKLFVADTGNYRVLVWNTIPTQNNQPADFVLGQPNLTSSNHPPSDTTSPATTASQLVNPISVTSDGTHLFVSDLGNNRVLIWNTIPATNGQPADVVIGQASMTTSNPNNGSAVCSAIGTDSSGNPAYPPRCASTLNFPRFALAAGGKLFVADSGNDRVLIFNSIPTSNGASADNVLGQPDFYNDLVTNVAQSIASTVIDNTSSVETLQSPTSLAFDGTNLYVADPFNLRVLVFTPGDTSLPGNSVVNWASEIIRQEGEVVFSGTPTAADTATVTIAGTAYTYTIKAKDTDDLVAQGIVALINAGAGDPNVQAIFGGAGSGSLYLSSKASNLDFDAISLAATVSNTANPLVATASGGYLTAGTAATGAPGMLVEINASPGQPFSDQTLTSPLPQVRDVLLPTSLGGVQIVVDGTPAPILSVSPTQIIIQLSFALFDRSSSSIYVRTVHNDGTTTVTNPTSVYLAVANPGLFNKQAYPGQPRPWAAAGALHQLTNPNAVVSIDGSVVAKDVATITIAGVAYNYTVVASDTLTTIAQNLANLINASDPNVTASLGPAFSRVILTAKQPGAAGTGITVTGTVSASASVTATAYSSATCCDVPVGQPITVTSPAQPGEQIVLLGAGLGALLENDAQAGAASGGKAFFGPTPNTAGQSVSATMGGVTAEVISAGFPLYSYGVYQIQAVVPTTLTNNAFTPFYIAQNAYISNTVSVPVATPGTTLSVTTSGPGAGITAAGNVVVSPASVVFTQQEAPSLSFGSQTVTVQNIGAASFNVGSIAISGPNASDFTTAANSCGATLAPSSSCTVTVNFTPGSAGIRTATLVVNDAASSSSQTVLLSGVSAHGVQIVNQLTSKALDLPGGSPVNGTKLQQYEVATGLNQKWALVPVGHSFAIMNLQSGKVLDDTDSSYADGNPIQQWDYTGGPNQLWNLQSAGNGYSAIVSALSGKALTVAGSAFDDTTPIQQSTYTGSSSQLWKFATFQSFLIQSVGTGSVLDVQGASTENGAPIQEWQQFGFVQQQWFIIPVDQTYYKIVNVNSLKCLDVTDGNAGNQTLIQQYEYLGAPQQQWALVSTNTGGFAFINKLSGRALDITGAAPDNGTLIQQYDYFGTPQQQWLLIPAGYSGLY